MMESNDKNEGTSSSDQSNKTKEGSSTDTRFLHSLDKKGKSQEDSPQISKDTGGSSRWSKRFSIPNINIKRVKSDAKLDKTTKEDKTQELEESSQTSKGKKKALTTSKSSWSLLSLGKNDDSSRSPRKSGLTEEPTSSEQEVDDPTEKGKSQELEERPQTSRGKRTTFGRLFKQSQNNSFFLDSNDGSSHNSSDEKRSHEALKGIIQEAINWLNQDIDKIEAKSKDLEVKRSELGTIMKEQKKLQSEILNVQGEAVALHKQIESLKELLSSTLEDENYEQTIQKHMSSLRQSFDGFDQQIKGLSENMQRSENLKSEMTKKSNKLNENIIRLEDTLNNFNSLFKNIKEKIIQEDDTSKKILKDIDSLKEIFVNLHEIHEKLQINESYPAANMHEMRENVKNLKLEYDKIHTQIQDLEKGQILIKQEMIEKKYKQSIEVLLRQIEDNKRENLEKMTRLEEYSTQLDHSQQEVTNLKHQLDQKEKQHQKLKTRLEENRKTYLEELQQTWVTSRQQWEQELKNKCVKEEPRIYHEFKRKISQIEHNHQYKLIELEMKRRDEEKSHKGENDELLKINIHYDNLKLNLSKDRHNSIINVFEDTIVLLVKKHSLDLIVQHKNCQDLRQINGELIQINSKLSEENKTWKKIATELEQKSELHHLTSSEAIEDYLERQISNQNLSEYVNEKGIAKDEMIKCVKLITHLDTAFFGIPDHEPLVSHPPHEETSRSQYSTDDSSTHHGLEIVVDSLQAAGSSSEASSSSHRTDLPPTTPRNSSQDLTHREKFATDDTHNAPSSNTDNRNNMPIIPYSSHAGQLETSWLMPTGPSSSKRPSLQIRQMQNSERTQAITARFSDNKQFNDKAWKERQIGQMSEVRAIASETKEQFISEDIAFVRLLNEECIKICLNAEKIARNIFFAKVLQKQGYKIESLSDLEEHKSTIKNIKSELKKDADKYEKYQKKIRERAEKITQQAMSFKQDIMDTYKINLKSRNDMVRAEMPRLIAAHSADNPVEWGFNQFWNKVNLNVGNFNPLIR
jgi:predicted  nucleic acid-binding Zn-ribbon protein